MHEETKQLLANVPDLTNNTDFKKLWYDGWYDGELDGMCEWLGQKHWFFYIDDEDYFVEDKKYTYRVYGVYKISQAQIEHEEYWQSLYELCCGNINRYDMPGSEKDSRVPENKFYRDFYYARSKISRKEIDYKKIKIDLVGWFKY